MRYIPIIFLLLFVTPAKAEWNDWSPLTKSLFVSSQIAITADWATTRDSAKKRFPNNTYETNPILGRYPSTGQVDAYMIGLLVSNYYITEWFPPEWRPFYLAVRIISATQAAQNNMALGFDLKF
jgi:hypothetical protein